MDPDRWKRIETLFHEALERDGRDRSGFLDRACGDDTPMRAEVEVLLEQHSVDDFLDGPSGVTPGTRLSHYEILSPLGRGGMGDVWRARDTILDREVAIKTLPAEFAQSGDRLARFEREAKLLASLNHANIAAVHGFEQDSEIYFLIMELVEGDTLGDRVGHGGVPVEESLRLALQIAEALEAAHEKGVIHRDLKPANIMVTRDHKVKVLDFGLAKALAGDGPGVDLSQLPTASMAGTKPGVLLGTPAYMSPEQARGEAVDRRADVWAFGCLLFEMLTGRGPFHGTTLSDILASVLKTDPDWTELPAKLHPRIRVLLERCLEKDAKDRYLGIGDARVEIQRVLEDPAGAMGVPVGEAMTLRPASKRPWVATLVVGILAGASGWMLRPMPTPEPQPVARFAYLLPDGQEFSAPPAPMVVLSPDGMHLAYSANDQLYIRNLDGVESRPVSGTDQGGIAAQPVFSPDSQSLVYIDGASGPFALKRVPIVGGTPVTIYDGMADPPQDVSWDISGTMVFSTIDGIVRIPENGGATELLVEAVDGEDLGVPQILPGGEWILFTTTAMGPGEGDLSRWDAGQIVAQPLGPGERKVIWEGSGDARYVPTGHLVYALGATLFAIPFDLERMEVTGGPVSIVEGVRRSGSGYSPTGNYTFSDNGTFANIPTLGSTGAGSDGVLALVDRSGEVEPLDVGPDQYRGPRVSPDGAELAVEIIGDNQRSAVWIYDLAGRRAFRRLPGAGSNVRPIWTPDGLRVTFASDRDGTWGIYWQPADGSGVAQRLTTAEQSIQHWPDSWSPDTGTLSFTRIEPNFGAIGGQTIWTVSIDEEGNAGAPEELVPASAGGSDFSPGGDWIAYRNGNSAVGPTNQVHVQPFPPTGAFHAVTEEGGAYPLWSMNGRELFYRRPAAVGGTSSVLTGVEVTTDGGFTWGDERVLPIDSFLSFFGYRDYDIMPDGEQLVINVPVASTTGAAEPARPQINVVLNWFEELKERVPVP